MEAFVSLLQQEQLKVIQEIDHEYWTALEAPALHALEPPLNGP